MKLNQLERILEILEGYSRPSEVLEQYRTPSGLAARLLYHAALNRDIGGRRVCDLGCGTGILGIGAALLGASLVTGVDIDPGALAIARENAARAGVDLVLLCANTGDPEVPGLVGACDTVVMNPPFGAQTLHADRAFIDAAIAIAPKVYGIFNAGSRSFVQAYLGGRGEIREEIGGLLPIRRTFSFHREAVREIPVEIFVLERVEREG